MPTDTQRQALRQLKNVTANNNYVHTASVNTSVPGDFKSILVGGSFETIRARNLVRMVSDLVTESHLQADSHYSAAVKAKKERHYTSWASGEGDTFRRFKATEATTFCDNLFNTVSAVTNGWGNLDLGTQRANDALTQQSLNRKDLFHGHLRLDRSGAKPDLVIVFHAKEFPSDTCRPYVDMANAFYQAAHVQAPPSFTAPLPSYEIRNSIWSLGKNRIWNIRYQRNPQGLVPQNHPYRCLLGNPFDNPDGGGYSADDLVLTEQPADPLKLAEEFLGEDICNINCFAGEGVSSFVKMRAA